MNILVLGNGFDLAHGLPTRYTDFLEFCERISKIYTYNEKTRYDEFYLKCICDWKINDEIKNIICKTFDERICKIEVLCDGTELLKVFTKNSELDKFYSFIKDNIWVDYFVKRQSSIKENWIDFELEIAKVIKKLDKSKKEKRKEERGYIEKILANTMLEKSIDIYQDGDGLDKVISVLNAHLEKLIYALEIYFCCFVEQIECKGFLPDITDVLLEKKNEEQMGANIKVLNFNYTNTFSKKYDKKGRNIECSHIHGKVDRDKENIENNMVLGINEYLSDKKKNKKLEFIAFKKYYQRMLKGTGCEYKQWIAEIKKSAKETEKRLRKKYLLQIPFEEFTVKHYLYIFGHSLNVTDKDILRELILNDNVYTKIYYFQRYDNCRNGDLGKKDLSEKITNLVRIIGQDELIKRTGGTTKTIEFCLQKELITIDQLCN